MNFERSAREQAVEDIRQALREEREDERLAEPLDAIAADYDVRTEIVVAWIHHQERPGCHADFIDFARRHAETMRDIRESATAEEFMERQNRRAHA